MRASFLPASFCILALNLGTLGCSTSKQWVSATPDPSGSEPAELLTQSAEEEERLWRDPTIREAHQRSWEVKSLGYSTVPSRAAPSTPEPATQVSSTPSNNASLGATAPGQVALLNPQTQTSLALSVRQQRLAWRNQALRQEAQAQRLAAQRARAERDRAARKLKALQLKQKQQTSTQSPPAQTTQNTRSNKRRIHFVSPVAVSK